MHADRRRVPVPPRAQREWHDRTFAIASLASGLDIVRKAPRQPRNSDGQTRPSIKEPANPADDAVGPCLRRMDRLDAGLSHQRKPAIRTHGRGAQLASALCIVRLVGIAGEDDLDAPEPSGLTVRRYPGWRCANGQVRKNPSRSSLNGSLQKSRQSTRSLNPEPSAILRETR